MLKESVPFFGVTDMAASLRFWRDGLGFRVALSWEPGGDGKIAWCRLERDGAALMLQEYAPGRRPEGKLGLGVSVCFMCTDALALHKEATARGLAVRAEPFVGNNLWVVGFVDPDGYVVDFESPTDVPEDTTLSEWRAARHT